jgi:hypothetical protein
MDHLTVATPSTNNNIHDLTRGYVSMDIQSIVEQPDIRFEETTSPPDTHHYIEPLIKAKKRVITRFLKVVRKKS